MKPWLARTAEWDPSVVEARLLTRGKVRLGMSDTGIGRRPSARSAPLNRKGVVA